MNREFVFHHGHDRSAWSRARATLHRWAWRALCCGVPGAPCQLCTYGARLDNIDGRHNRVNQSTVTAECLARQHRPHAPRGRKSTPEMLTAVRCALSQLQGEPAPPLPSVTTSPGVMEPSRVMGPKQEPG